MGKIGRLSEEAIRKLRSGTSAPDVCTCVMEAVCNALDAQASSITVKVDLREVWFSVSDDGTGMDLADLTVAGTLYHTSKALGVADLSNLQHFGFRGEALASLQDIGTLEITTRHRTGSCAFTKIMHAGKTLSLRPATSPRATPGTTLVCHGLFAALPVRRKNISEERDFARIRQALAALALIHPHISFTLRNEASGAVALQTRSYGATQKSAFNTLFGASFPKPMQLLDVDHSYRAFSVTGFIASEGFHNASMQFIYINRRPVLRTPLHKLLADLFAVSKIGRGVPGPEALVTSAMKGTNAKHGVYCINITCPYDQYDICLEPTKSLVEFENWDDVLKCLDSGVRWVMRRHGMLADADASAPPGTARRPASPDNDSSGASSREAFEDFDAPDTTTTSTTTTPAFWHNYKGKERRQSEEEDKDDDACSTSPYSTATATSVRSFSSFVSQFRAPVAKAPAPSTLPRRDASVSSRVVKRAVAKAAPPQASAVTAPTPPPPSSSVSITSSPSSSAHQRRAPSPLPFFPAPKHSRPADEDAISATISGTGASSDLSLSLSSTTTTTSSTTSTSSSSSTPIPEIACKWRCAEDRPDDTSDGTTCEECHSNRHNSHREASLPSPALPQQSGTTTSTSSINALYEAFQRDHACDEEPLEPLMSLEPASALRPGLRSISVVRPHRFTKDMFERVTVVGQADRKFITCTLAEPPAGQPLGEPVPTLVVVVDQHAADERVNVERLERELFERPAVDLDDEFVPFSASQLTPSQRRRRQVASVVLAQPLQMHVPAAYHALLERFRGDISPWGLAYTCAQAGEACLLAVERLPAIFFKGTSATPEKWVSEAFVREFVDELMDSLQHAGSAGLATIPRCIMRAVNMKACHDAIKFGDALTHNECVALIARLAQCRFPFQCAHGRPSMIPLFDMRDI